MRKKYQFPVLGIIILVVIFGGIGVLFLNNQTVRQSPQLSNPTPNPHAQPTPIPDFNVYSLSGNSVTVGQIKFQLPAGYFHLYCQYPDESSGTYNEIIFSNKQLQQCDKGDIRLVRLQIRPTAGPKNPFASQCRTLEMSTIRQTTRKQLKDSGYAFEYIQEPIDAENITEKDLNRVICIEHNDLEYDLSGPYISKSLLDSIFSSIQYTNTDSQTISTPTSSSTSLIGTLRSSSRKGWLTYTNENLGIVFEYPENIPNTQIPYSVVDNTAGITVGRGGNVPFAISVFKSISVQNYYLQQKKDTSTPHNINGMPWISELTKITVNKMEAYEYTLYSDAEDQRFILFPKEDDIYRLTLEPKQANIALSDQILATFHIK